MKTAQNYVKPWVLRNEAISIAVRSPLRGGRPLRSFGPSKSGVQLINESGGGHGVRLRML